MGAGMNDQRLYWIALNKVNGIGPVRFRALLEAFPDVQTAWEARASDLKAAGLPPASLENLPQLRSLTRRR